MLALVLIMPCMVRVFMIYFFEFTLSILNLLETRSSRDHRLPWAEATYLSVHDPTKHLATKPFFISSCILTVRFSQL